MSMAVTDDQVATLRAQLGGNLDEHEQRLAQLSKAEAATGYAALIAASFSLAAYQRFAKKGDAATVMRFVADVRSRTEDTATIDPRVAERLILATFTDEEIDDINLRVRYETQIVLLAAIISDSHLDEAQLDQFLTKARGIADEWTS
jgi:hypothetical protein